MEVERAEDPGAAAGSDGVLPGTHSYVRDLESLKAGGAVKVLLLKRSCFDMHQLCTTQFGDKFAEYCKRLSVGFADPPWGVNKDPTKFGGIDLAEERWGT